MTRMGIPKRQAQGQAGTIGAAMTIERAAVQQTVIAVVEELLDAIDSEYEEAVSDATWLIADGGFSSIDFVQMTVMIEEQLGSKIGFQDMLMQQGKYVDAHPSAVRAVQSESPFKVSRLRGRGYEAA